MKTENEGRAKCFQALTGFRQRKTEELTSYDARQPLPEVGPVAAPGGLGGAKPPLSAA